ncbi:prophage tail fiber family protein [Escherichia coli DEC4C]|nr:prophage tail fiber family protein [Escherichia coli DEC4C]
MNDISSDDIFLLKQRLAEQEALIHALQEKLSNREREIDHLQAQLDKLRRMNFGSRSEKVSRRIAQMEADLNRLQKESDTLTGRVYDPAVQRPLRQTRTRKPFPESLPRDEKRLLPAAPCCPNCGGSLSYLGEDTADGALITGLTFLAPKDATRVQGFFSICRSGLVTGRGRMLRGWMKWAVIQAEQENDMNILKNLMQRLCGCGKHDDHEHGELLTAQLRLGPADILESDENGIIPEQARVITQVVILDADKKQIQCVVRPLQILRADGTWENIGGMK